MHFRLLSIAAGTALLLTQTLAAQKPAAIPRAADGHPDLQGIWTNVTLTTLERPVEFSGKATLTTAEASAIEKREAAQTIDGNTDGKLLQQAGSAGTGAYNNLFFDRGSELAKINGLKRTSLVVEPPDGKIPPITAEARQRNAAMVRNFNRFDSAQDRPLSERCIIGHWEGDTLVVDTTNFADKVRFRGSSENLHVIERFTRTAGNTIIYKATIDDPTTFSKQWAIEYPFVATAGPIYEYACHEGNYAMEDILGGARKTEAEGGKQ
jgi:hypothetical protein